MIERSRKIPKDLFASKGVLYHSNLFTLKVSQYKDHKDSLVSVSVSKKVAKNAVSRNKIRRQTYAILASLLKTLPHNLLLFFQAKKGIETTSFEDIKKDITLLISKLTPSL